MPGTTHQDGVTEMRNGTLMKLVRSMMSYSSSYSPLFLNGCMH